MIEIAFGLLVIAAAVAILMGAADTLLLPVPDLFPIIGFTGTAVIAGAGLLLILHGAYRLVRNRRTSGRHALRSAGLLAAMLLLIALFGFAAPLLVEPLNLITIRGFPAGFYIAAQGALIALVIVAFVAATRQDAIDSEENAWDQSASGKSGNRFSNEKHDKAKS
jgi:putative solute:sodium symporter small subunit